MDTNITESFIAMVEAYKVKPELEAQVKQLGEDNALCYQTIDLKNELITELKEQNAILANKLSEVMKERDDASFRSLELEEKLGGIERLLGLAERVESARKAEHEAAVAALKPTQGELAEVEQTIMEDQRDPFYSGPIDPVVIEPQGQSVVDPTPVGQSEYGTTTSKDGPATQTPSDDWDQYNPYNYRGRPYSEKPWWVNDSEWYDAGGLMD